MTDYILPALFLAIFVLATLKDLPIYTYFSEGAKGAINLAMSVFPNLAAIMLMMEMLNQSGLMALFSSASAPLLAILGIPSELSQLVFIRPFSGSGAIAALTQVLSEFGADSYIGRCAAAIMGCTDTVLYMSVVYFSTTKVKKLRFAVPIALFTNLVAIILCCQLCKIM